jgi:HK97 family phage major capsid protein
VDIRAHVITLNETRARVFNELKAVLDDTAGRERNEEEKAVIARLDARIDELDAEVREYVARATRENEAAELREAQARVFGEAPKASATAAVDELRAFIDASLRGDKVSMEIDLRGARRERELLRQGASAEELRVLAWDTGSSGSLVPTTLARTLYEYMEASNGIWMAPTTRINTTSGEQLEFPRLAAHAIGTQVSGQGTALAGTDPTFAKMTLNAFKYGQLVVVASEVVQDSGIDIASFLGRDLGRGLGRVIATDLVVGTGTNEPNGIMTAIVGSGTIATGGSLITPTVEKLIDLQYSVNDSYRSDPSCAWLMNDSTAGTIRKLRDGAGGTIGAFLWEPSLTSGIINGTPDRLLGKPVYVDSNVAAAGSNAKTVAFGAMNAYYVRSVGNPVLESDNSRYFDTDQIGYRVKTRVDGDLIDTAAVNAIKQSV